MRLLKELAFLMWPKSGNFEVVPSNVPRKRFNKNQFSVKTVITKNLVPTSNILIFLFLIQITCHGLLWIPCWIGFIWVINSKSLYQMQINLLLGTEN